MLQKIKLSHKHIARSKYSKNVWLTHLLRHDIMKNMRNLEFKDSLPSIAFWLLQDCDLLIKHKFIVLLLSLLYSGMNYNSKNVFFG